MSSNTGTPKNINFLFETNGKTMALGVPILKHFRVFKRQAGKIAYLERVPIHLKEFVNWPHT